MKNLTELLNMLHESIQSTIGYPGLFFLIFAVIIMAYIAWNILVRGNYKNEKFRFGEKRRNIYWYDEQGTKIYPKPLFENPPKKKQAVKR